MKHRQQNIECKKILHFVYKLSLARLMVMQNDKIFYQFHGVKYNKDKIILQQEELP